MADETSRRLCLSHSTVQWDRFLRGGDGSLQVVWRTDLEVDLEQTQHYCVELLALYLRRMIVYIQYSMMFLACAGAAETMTMPSHGPHGKSSNLLVKSLSFQERNMLFVDRPVKEKQIHLDS